MLPHELNQLEANGLVRNAEDRPEPEYAFRHALVQQAAYASLLKTDRRSIHAAVAHTLEPPFYGLTDDIAAALAEHFEPMSHSPAELGTTFLKVPDFMNVLHEKDRL